MTTFIHILQSCFTGKQGNRVPLKKPWKICENLSISSQYNKPWTVRISPGIYCTRHQTNSYYRCNRTIGSMGDVLHRASDWFCWRLWRPIMVWMYQLFHLLRTPFAISLQNNKLWRAILINSSHLILEDKDCPSGYARIRIWGNPIGQLWRMVHQDLVFIDTVPTCLLKRYGKYWLSSPKSLRLLNVHADDCPERIHDPALDTAGEDMVTALICSEPTQSMKAYLSRKRFSHWPPENTIRQLARLPGLLTATGHKLSPDKDIEFRLSWSIHEVILVSSLPIWIKQGYWAFKNCLKNAKMRLQKTGSVPENNAEEGRSVISSYHLKTVLLWELEQPTIWQRECPFHVLMLLLERLASTLQPATNGTRPRFDHYFLTQCDLIESVPDDEISVTLRCITDIQEDPLAALIRAPVFPSEVYLGDYTPTHVYLDGPEEQEGAKEGEKLLALLRGLLKHGQINERINQMPAMRVDSGITSAPSRLSQNINCQGADQNSNDVTFQEIVIKLAQFLAQLNEHCSKKYHFYRMINAALPLRRPPCSLVKHLENMIDDHFTDVHTQP